MEKLKEKKFVALVLTICLLVASSSLGVTVYAATHPAFTTIIEGGSMVDTASYVIFKDGSTYFAKNGTTGAIDYSGPNVTEVTQSCIDNLPFPTAQSYSGLLQFGSGVFYMGQLNITGKRVIIEGLGRFSTDFLWGSWGESYLIYGNATAGSGTIGFQLRHCSIRTSGSVGNNAIVIFLRNNDLVHLEDIDFYGVNEKGLTFLYLSSCYYGRLEHLRIKKVKYGIYGDGVYKGDIYQTPNCWTLDCIDIWDIDEGGASVYLERCVLWAINNLCCETVNASYGILLNGSSLITFSQLDIVDAPFPDVGVYMTGWTQGLTSAITFLDSHFVGNDYCVEINDYAGNITFINPVFDIATTAIKFTGTTVVNNFVLINPHNKGCTNFIVGKSYTTWLNGTYIAIP